MCKIIEWLIENWNLEKNRKLISGEGEREKIRKRKKNVCSRQSIQEWPVDPLVSQAKALLVGHPVTGEWLW